MSKKTLASVARFAHLLGINTKAEAPGEEDNDAPERMDGESDEDYEKRCEEDKKAKKAKKAEDSDDAADAEADDKGEAGDEDDDTDSKEKAARKAERARCAAIFGSKAAASRPDMAAHLAFETDMAAAGAIKMLDAIAAGQPKPSGLGSRMASVHVPKIGTDNDAPDANPTTAAGASALAASAILAAGKKARGEKA